MKITLKELSDVNQSLLKFLSKEIDVKLAYRMRKISGKLVAELRHIEQAIADLRVKHGATETPAKDHLNRDVMQLIVPEKNKKAFEHDVEAFLAMEIEIGADKIPYECLESIGRISALDLANIEKFIEEHKKEEKKK